MTKLITWKDKLLEDYSKEELIQICAELTTMVAIEKAWVEKWRNETMKAWSSLRSK